MFRSPGPIAFQLGPLSIRWYGILMALAMALGLWLAYRDARRRGLDPESFLKAAELGLLGALVGAAPSIRRAASRPRSWACSARSWARDSITCSSTWTTTHSSRGRSSRSGRA